MGHAIKRRDDFIFKQNTTYQPFVFNLVDSNGLPIDLTGCTVRLTIADNSSIVLDKSMNIDDAVNGYVSYTLLDTDVINVGSYNMEITVIFSDGKKEIFPDDDYIRLKVSSNLESLQSGNQVLTQTQYDILTSNYDSLNSKVNDNSSQLAQIAHQVSASGTDDTSAINTALTNYNHVYLPDGNYTISNTIVIPTGKKLTLSKNANIHFTSTSTNVFQLQNQAEIDGGNITTPQSFSAAVLYLTGIATYVKARNVVMTGTTSVEIGTGTGIFLDGTSLSNNGNNNYGYDNLFENIEINWMGLGINIADNGAASNNTWWNSNIFNNIKLWHVHQIVNITRYCGGNIFNNIISQTGSQDTLLYHVDGSLNLFNNIIYYDLPGGCSVVNFDTHSGSNQFCVWFVNAGGYSFTYNDTGNKNTVTKLGGFSEAPNNLTLNTPWVNIGGNYQTAQYYKNNLSEVRLRGRVQSGAINQVIGNLPLPYRPNKHLNFIVASGDNNWALVQVKYTGDIIPLVINGSDISLDGIGYRTDY